MCYQFIMIFNGVQTFCHTHTSTVHTGQPILESHSEVMKTPTAI